MSRYRNERIYVMVTKEEKELILAKMKKAGMTNLGQFVRTALMIGEFINVNTNGLRELTYEVNKVGVNLNQIAKAVNTSGNIYKNEIEEIQNDFRYISNFVKDLNDKVNKIKLRG